MKNGFLKVLMEKVGLNWLYQDKFLPQEKILNPPNLQNMIIKIGTTNQLNSINRNILQLRNINLNIKKSKRSMEPININLSSNKKLKRQKSTNKKLINKKSLPKKKKYIEKNPLA